MKHLNGNQLCSIFIKTTGLSPQTDEITELAILPLDVDVKPHDTYNAFHTLVKPERIDNLDELCKENNQEFNKSNHNTVHIMKGRSNLVEAMVKGTSRYRVASYLAEDYFPKFNFGKFKKFTPIAFDWPFIRTFLTEFLGPLTLDQLFTVQYRDIVSVSTFENDKADRMGMELPYSKTDLVYLTNLAGIERNRTSNSLEIAADIAEIYRKTLSKSYG